MGGCDSDGKETTAIHMYNKSWEVISHMVTPRNHCLVAVLLQNQLMVVGGITTDSSGLIAGGEIDSVEIASII